MGVRKKRGGGSAAPFLWIFMKGVYMYISERGKRERETTDLFRYMMLSAVDTLRKKPLLGNRDRKWDGWVSSLL